MENGGQAPRVIVWGSRMRGLVRGVGFQRGNVLTPRTPRIFLLKGVLKKREKYEWLLK